MRYNTQTQVVIPELSTKVGLVKAHSTTLDSSTEGGFTLARAILSYDLNPHEDSVSAWTFWGIKVICAPWLLRLIWGFFLLYHISHSNTAVSSWSNEVPKS